MASHPGQNERSGVAATPERGGQAGDGTAAELLRPMQRWSAVFLLLAMVLWTTLPPLLLPGAEEADPLLGVLGRRAALLGLGLLFLQLVLAARLRFLDVALGLDTVMRAHRAVGLLAAALLLAHPALLLAAAHGDLPLLRWRVLLGAGALLVLGTGVAAALLFRRLRVDYNRWRALHRAMLVAVALGAAHGRAIGTDLQTSPILRAWWFTAVAGASCILVWRSVFVPRWMRRRFRVESIRTEARGVWTLRLVEERGRPLRYLPGQFVFLTLPRPERPAEEHPFTLSSSPTRGAFIAATIKESGDFTRTISRTRPGDPALVEGPFGRFSLAHHPARRFVFISAGVGCTPMASMLRFLSDTADLRPVLYLCGNRTEADIAFREELERLPSHMKVVHVLSQPDPSWTGARGRLDGAAIRRWAGDALDGAGVFLCGPPPFLSSVRRSLRDLGVPRARVHAERFTAP